MHNNTMVIKYLFENYNQCRYQFNGTLISHYTERNMRGLNRKLIKQITSMFDD